MPSRGKHDISAGDAGSLSKSPRTSGPGCSAMRCSATVPANASRHWFEQHEDGTRMREEFEFASALAPFDALILKPYLRRFLLARNDTIRRVAEGTDWLRYLS